MFYYSFDWPYSDLAVMRDDKINDTMLQLWMNSKNTMNKHNNFILLARH